MLAGEILKKRREDLNLTVKEVAEQLKIRGDYLDAIERDAFEKLPVAVYSRGYIRAYADYLRIDAGPILDVYSTHLSQPGPSTILPIASSKKKGPGVFTAVVLLLAACLALFGYFYGPRFFHEKDVVPEMKQPDGHAVAPAMVPAVTPVFVPEAAPPVSIPVQPVVPLQKEHVLRITASEHTWLSVRINDSGAEEVTLRPGETKDWRFPDKAVLRVGNAGGITVDFDDKTISPLGSRGQVMTLVLPPE